MGVFGDGQRMGTDTGSISHVAGSIPTISPSASIKICWVGSTGSARTFLPFQLWTCTAQLEYWSWAKIAISPCSMWGESLCTFLGEVELQKWHRYLRTISHRRVHQMDQLGVQHRYPLQNTKQLISSCGISGVICNSVNNSSKAMGGFLTFCYALCKGNRISTFPLITNH